MTTNTRTELFASYQQSKQNKFDFSSIGLNLASKESYFGDKISNFDDDTIGTIINRYPLIIHIEKYSEHVLKELKYSQLWYWDVNIQQLIPIKEQDILENSIIDLTPTDGIQFKIIS